MAILRFKNVEDAPADGQAVQPVHIDGLPSGGSTPGNNSITTAMLQANAVTNEKIADGTIQAAKLASGVIPTPPGNATTTTAGLVKKASATTAVASPDATAAASETVTKEEFDKVVALANELKKQVNDLISKAKTAGQMA